MVVEREEQDKPSLMRLADLYRAIPEETRELERIPDVGVTGVVMDSRQVQAGNLFVALLGERADGHNFIPQAIHQGAIASVGTKPLSGLSVPYLRVKDGRRALAYMSAAWQGFPARKMLVIGVTVTSPKLVST